MYVGAVSYVLKVFGDNQMIKLHKVQNPMPQIGDLYRWYGAGNLVVVVEQPREEVCTYSAESLALAAETDTELPKTRMRVVVETYGHHVRGEIRKPARKIRRTHTLSEYGHLIPDTPGSWMGTHYYPVVLRSVS